MRVFFNRQVNGGIWKLRVSDTRRNVLIDGTFFPASATGNMVMHEGEGINMLLFVIQQGEY